VDAVSYLRLGRVFVANMTGNLVFLGFSADPHSGLSAAALGIQNATVRRLGAPDLTTTVLTLTLTGLAADSTPAGGPGAKPHRRLGSVAAMLAGAAAGAGLLQASPTAVIAVAAALVAAVSASFLTTTRTPARPSPAPALAPVGRA
jgi:uncharacterized membrane protein YoaK (UPF0700 family)